MKRILLRAWLVLVLACLPLAIGAAAPFRSFGAYTDLGAASTRWSTATDNWTMFAKVLWFGFAKPSSSRGLQDIICNGVAGSNGWTLAMAGDDAVGGGATANTASIIANGVQWASGNTALVAGTTYYLVGSREAGTIKLRVNGTDQTMNHNPTPGSPGTAASVGGETTNGYEFNGIIYDVGVWDGAVLTTGEKQSLEGGTLPASLGASSATLRAAYHFAGAAGDATDLSAGGHNLTFTGTLAATAAAAGGSSKSASFRGD